VSAAVDVSDRKVAAASSKVSKTRKPSLFELSATPPRPVILHSGAPAPFFVSMMITPLLASEP